MYNEYGALYNWYAVDNSNGLSIDGWRIPSKTDLDTLATYLGSDPGGKLKEVGTEHWTPDNIGATDMYGFKSIGVEIEWILQGILNTLILLNIYGLQLV